MKKRLALLFAFLLLVCALPLSVFADQQIFTETITLDGQCSTVRTENFSINSSTSAYAEINDEIVPVHGVTITALPENVKIVKIEAKLSEEIAEGDVWYGSSDGSIMNAAVNGNAAVFEGLDTINDGKVIDVMSRNPENKEIFKEFTISYMLDPLKTASMVGQGSMVLIALFAGLALGCLSTTVVFKKKKA